MHIMKETNKISFSNEKNSSWNSKKKQIYLMRDYKSALCFSTLYTFLSGSLPFLSNIHTNSSH